MGYRACVDDCEGELKAAADAEAESFCSTFCGEGFAHGLADGESCAPVGTTQTDIVVNSEYGNVCHDPEAYAFNNLECYDGAYNVGYAQGWHANCDPDEYDGFPLDLMGWWDDPEYGECD